MEEKLDKLKIAEVKEQHDFLVTGCDICPFVRIDTEAWCTFDCDERPVPYSERKVADFCPLRTSEITVKLKS